SDADAGRTAPTAASSTLRNSWASTSRAPERASASAIRRFRPSSRIETFRRPAYRTQRKGEGRTPARRRHRQGKLRETHYRNRAPFPAVTQLSFTGRVRAPDATRRPLCGPFESASSGPLDRGQTNHALRVRPGLAALRAARDGLARRAGLGPAVSLAGHAAGPTSGRAALGAPHGGVRAGGLTARVAVCPVIRPDADRRHRAPHLRHAVDERLAEEPQPVRPFLDGHHRDAPFRRLLG